jgi:hypothetical protein
MRLVAEFATPDEYLAAHEEEISRGGLLLKGATLEGPASTSDCTLVVRIGGEEVAEEQAKLAFATPGVGVAVFFPVPPATLDALATRLRAPEPELAAGESVQHNSARQRFAELPVAQKMALALQSGREERFHLLRDNNKTLHAQVLRNPRIGLDEVQAAAKLPSLSPDALKAIADHPEWGQNAAICAALVRNPRTPMPVALRLLPRVPDREIRAIAKGAARQPIVDAARKLLQR